MEVNAVDANGYFTDPSTSLDAKYDINKDGTVDVADYRLATLYLQDEDKASLVGFSQTELDTVFAALIAEDETVNRYQDITPETANEEAEKIIARVKAGLVDPANARTLNELQTIGATLTRYIKECADIAKVLGEQMPGLKTEVDALEGERNDKVKTYTTLQEAVESKTDTLNTKTKKILEISNTLTQEREAECERTIETCITNYKNGEYVGKSLSDVIVSALGDIAGFNVSDLKREMNNASAIGLEIRDLCSDIENLVVDIRDIEVRFAAKNTDYNRLSNNRTEILLCAQTASANYQDGYTVRQNMREEIIGNYYTAGNNGVTMSNPQLGKLAEFLDAKELENMPFADAWNILKETFNACGITYNDETHKMTIPIGHDDTAKNIYNALATAIQQNYGVTSTREDIGYESGDDGNGGVSGRTDPLGFTSGDMRFEFVADKNGNGKFDDASEFLGAESGWDEMIAYDVDGDNIISGDELENLKVLALNQETGQYTYMNASLAGIDSINLNSYQEVNSEQINNDVLAGTFKVNINGEEIEAQHTLDTQMNLENKYSFLFGSEMTDLSGTYKENPFLAEFRETVDTENVVRTAESDISSTDAESDNILTRGERRVNSIVNSAVDDARAEKAPAETQATGTDENSTDDENKKKLL